MFLLRHIESNSLSFALCIMFDVTLYVAIHNTFQKRVTLMEMVSEFDQSHALDTSVHLLAISRAC